MALLRVARLPAEALAAAAQFHAEVVPEAHLLLDARPDCLTLVFAPDSHAHRGWRLAAIQSLAREYAPARVNALVTESEHALAAALKFLEAAPGVTGQLLELDDTGAAEVLSSGA